MITPVEKVLQQERLANLRERRRFADAIDALSVNTKATVVDVLVMLAEHNLNSRGIAAKAQKRIAELEAEQIVNERAAAENKASAAVKAAKKKFAKQKPAKPKPAAKGKKK